MKKFTLLSAAALHALKPSASATGDDTDDQDAGPAPGEGGSDQGGAEDGGNSDPGSEGKGEQKKSTDASDAGVEVVTATDASAAIAKADADGYARANARMEQVFASDAAQANPSMAAFMLANSTADADKIIAQLGSSAPKTEAKGAGIPDTDVNLGRGTDPSAIVEEGGVDEKTAASGWDKANANVAQSYGLGAQQAPAQSNADGTITTRIPPTGY